MKTTESPPHHNLERMSFGRRRIAVVCQLALSNRILSNMERKRCIIKGSGDCSRWLIRTESRINQIHKYKSAAAAHVSIGAR